MMFYIDAPVEGKLPTKEQRNAFEHSEALRVALPTLTSKNHGQPKNFLWKESTYKVGPVLLQQQDKKNSQELANVSYCL